MQSANAPSVAIIDWNMPGMDGPTLCQELRETPALSAMYVILLTSNKDQKDVVAGLESGADDYIIKPFDWNELRARLRIGSRIVGLQQTLAARVAELQVALANVRTLSGLLPICAYCKRIRDDKDYWTADRAVLSASTRRRSSATASARNVSSSTSRNESLNRQSRAGSTTMPACPIPNNSSRRCARS